MPTTYTCNSANNGPSQTHVQDKINLCAPFGDTVIVPDTLDTGQYAGGFAVWTSQVNFNGKSITLTGAGIGNTVIKDNTPIGSPAGMVVCAAQTVANPSSISGFTFIQGAEDVVWITAGGTPYRCIAEHYADPISNKPGSGTSWNTFWQATTTAAINIAPTIWAVGIHYVATATHTNGGMLHMQTSQRVEAAYRVHHCRFVVTLGIGGATSIYANSYGLIDHCTFDINIPGSPPGSYHAIECYGWSSVGADDRGYGQWAEAPGLGQKRAIFIEQNTFNEVATMAAGEVVIDGFRGARVVIRNNIFNNCIPGWHGTDSGFYRSVISGEIYDNNFRNDITTSQVLVGVTNYTCIKGHIAKTAANKPPNAEFWSATGSSGVQWVEYQTYVAAHNMRGLTCRGGTVRLFRNHYNGNRKTWDGYTLQYFRVSSSSPLSNWQVCDGTSWELNGATPAGAGSYTCSTTGGFRFDDATNSTLGAETAPNPGFTKYFDGPIVTSGGVSAGYPGRDQPGRDSQQTLSPCYEWLNDSQDGSTPPNFGLSGYDPFNQPRLDLLIMLNREFFNNTEDPAFGTTYTTYQYPHPLNISGDTLAPAAPTGLTVTLF